MKAILFVFFICVFVAVAKAKAEELPRQTITSCAYQAGTAFEIQKIRQSEGDDWKTFSANIKRIYQEDQGRKDLLHIAERVFFHPVSTSAESIHDMIFDSCVQRQQGSEPTA